MERWENEQNNSEMMIYTTEDGLTKIETTFDGDTVWLSIDQMAELFQRDKSTISRHIKNIFAEGTGFVFSVLAGRLVDSLLMADTPIANQQLLSTHSQNPIKML